MKKNFLRFLKKNGIYIIFVEEFNKKRAKEIRKICGYPIRFDEYFYFFCDEEIRITRGNIIDLISNAFSLGKSKNGYDYWSNKAFQPKISNEIK